MTEVKICGIGNREDAIAACECGADGVGFVFYDKSPRFISPEKSREIIERLPGDVARVGVFVDEDPRVVRRVFEYCRLDYIQLHGNESVDYCRGLPPGVVIRAICPQRAESMAGLDRWTVRAFLMDAPDPVRRGGTGNRSDWGVARETARIYPLILAGGLKPENVRSAIEEVSPAAVDVGSGVESAPGKKDHEKIRAFMEGVRRADGGTGRRIFDTNR